MTNDARAATSRRPKRGPGPLAWLLAAFLALGAVYLVATPPWEVPDEVSNLGYVNWLKLEGGLPPMDASILQTWVGQAASQPPLYYAIAALATWPLDTTDLAGTYVENTPATGGNVGHNRALHGSWEAVPTSPTIQGLVVARLMALLMGALAVWATYRLAQSIRPGRKDLAVVTGALVAFNPQFLYLSAGVNNATTAAAWSTVALWRLVATLRHPDDRNAVWLGLAMGLAWLSSTSALGLGIVVAAAVVVATARKRARPGHSAHDAHSARSAHTAQASHPARLALRPFFLAFGTAVVVGGWWYARSVMAYGSFTGNALLAAAAAASAGPATNAGAGLSWRSLWSLFISYWAAFGWGTVRYPEPLYRVWAIILSCAGTGLVLAARVRLRTGVDADAPDLVGDHADGEASKASDTMEALTWRGRLARLSATDWSFALLALWAVLTLLALLGTPAFNPRRGWLLFPAVGAIAVLAATGWDVLSDVLFAWGSRRWPGFKPRSNQWQATLIGALCLCSALSPTLLIVPQLRQPHWLSSSELSALPDRVERRFGKVAELVSLSPGPQPWRAGSTPSVRLCWRALSRAGTNYVLSLELQDAAGRTGAAYAGLPGGIFPTKVWHAGDALCQTVLIRLIGDLNDPDPYAIVLRLTDPESGEPLPMSDAQGKPVATFGVATVKILPPELPAGLRGPIGVP